MARVLAGIAVVAAGANAQSSELEHFPGKKIEDLVCKLATKQQIEDKATGAICKLIKEKVHFGVPDCEGLLDKVWDKVVSKCPKGADLDHIHWPHHIHPPHIHPPHIHIDKKKIEEAVCKLASKKMIEDKATGDICIAIKAEVPLLRLVPDCKGLLDKLWDDIVKKCPKGNPLIHLEHLHFPGKKIEELVCKLATKQQIEDKATGAICKLIKEKVHFGVPDCEGLLDKVWDKVVAKCPKSENVIVV
jgi:hypothetical protein